MKKILYTSGFILYLGIGCSKANAPDPEVVWGTLKGQAAIKHYGMKELPFMTIVPNNMITSLITTGQIENSSLNKDQMIQGESFFLDGTKFPKKHKAILFTGLIHWESPNSCLALDDSVFVYQYTLPDYDNESENPIFYKGALSGDFEGIRTTMTYGYNYFTLRGMKIDIITVFDFTCNNERVYSVGPIIKTIAPGVFTNNSSQ